MKEIHGQLYAFSRISSTRRLLISKNRERLLSISPSNRAVFDSLSTSLLAMSLDNYTLPSIPSSDPLHLPAIDAQIRNAGTGIRGGQNRWFDKAVSVVVETNGRAGVMGEHSPVDALIPSIAVEYVLAKPMERTQGAVEKRPEGQGWKALEWKTDEEMDGEIDQAQRRAQKIVGDSDASQLWWNEYGTDWIKKHGMSRIGSWSGR
jgi:carnitine O-acetyltransferase